MTMVERKSMLVRKMNSIQANNHFKIKYNIPRESYLTYFQYTFVFIAVKAKEHHRVEKSVPSRGHETSSLDQTTNQYPNFPSFPSLPTLSGAFQLHHLPPISAGIISCYLCSKLTKFLIISSYRYKNNSNNSFLSFLFSFKEEISEKKNSANIPADTIVIFIIYCVDFIAYRAIYSNLLIFL